jgi:cellobiose-specific phosphotransferase system component IIA
MIPKTLEHTGGERAATSAAERVRECQTRVRVAEAAHATASGERGRLLAASARGEDIKPVQLTKADDAAREAKAGLDLAAAVLQEATKQDDAAAETLRPLHNQWLMQSHAALKEARRQLALEADDLVAQANEKLAEANALIAQHQALPEWRGNPNLRPQLVPPHIRAKAAIITDGLGEGAVPTTAIRAAA